MTKKAAKKQTKAGDDTLRPTGGAALAAAARADKSPPVAEAMPAPMK